MKEAEKTALSEKLSALQAELSTAALELERLNRETVQLRDQERVRNQRHYGMLQTVAAFPRNLLRILLDYSRSREI